MIVPGKEFFGGKPGTVVQPAAGSSITVPPKEERKSLFERAKQSIAENIEAARSKTMESIEAQSRGKQGPIATGFQAAGNALGVVTDTVADAVSAGYQAIKPDKETKNIMEVFLGTQAGQQFASLVGEGAKKVQELKEKDPVLYRNLRSVMQVAEFAADWVGVGAGSKVVKEGAEAGVKAGKEIVEGTIDAGIETGAKVIDKVTDAASDLGRKAEGLVAKPIPKPVETVLRETPAQQFDEYAELARKAAVSNKEITPLVHVGKRAQEALDTIQRKLSAIGEQKSGVMSQAAVGNKPVGTIALKFRQELGKLVRGKTAVEGDTRLIQDVMNAAERLGSNPSAKEVDQLIDFIQDRLYTSGRDLTVPVTDGTTASLRKLTGELNENLKSQLPDSYRGLNQRYAEMIDVRNELNIKLGKDGERGGSLMKRVFSPSDNRTVELFAEVQKLTGIDLVNEATLAKFVMEAVGDARQKSLLEQLQLPSSVSPQGILGFVMDKATSKFNQPEDILRRARELTQQQ